MTTETKFDKRLIIIDGNSLINRAYYAIQRPMVTRDGIYTQGIFGFLNMLGKVKADYTPAMLAVAFDRKAPTFRHQAYEQYKAGRKKMPMELAMQMPLLKDILTAMHIEILEIDGFEADDILGTVARRGEEEGLEPLIITGDRDALQLASEKTKVLITKKGISEFELYDEAAMIEKYGFTPRQFIDYKALMGDSSDNIPGLPGVGEKTASKLILEYGSVETLIEKAETIENQKLRAKVEENATLAMMSKRLAAIVTEVPIEVDFQRMQLRDPDVGALAALYVKLELNSFLKKLTAPSGESGESTKSAKFEALVTESQGGFAFLDTVPTTAVDSLEDLKKATSEMEAAPFLVLKTFGSGAHRSQPLIYGVNILSEGHHWYLNTERQPELLFALLSFLAARDKPLAGHNLQADLYAIARFLKEQVAEADSVAGEAARALLHDFHPTIAFDTAVAQYLLNPSASNYALKTLVLTWFGKEIPDEGELLAAGSQMDLLSDSSTDYAVHGNLLCRAVASLIPAQRDKLQALGLEQVCYEAELPLIAPLAEMEAAGFAFDREAIREVGAEIAAGLERLAEEIYAVAGEEFNINSPQQLGIVLFEKMGLPSSRKTQRGYATGAEVLEKLRDKTPIIDKILEYRTLAKLQGTYIDGLIPLVGDDGKIHAHFQQTVTATGRISCAEPNLQNIPVRQELGRQIRKAFVPENPETILMSADYSQIELRILAHLSGDPWLIEDFRQGADIHRRTAARVFDIEESQVTARQRSSAKAVNFGIIYGISSFGLSEGLGITRQEAEGYIKDYFGEHPAVKAYLDGCVARAKRDGFVTTLLGRRRDIPEIGASNFSTRSFGERLAMNTPIQGSAADIIKLAMIRVCQSLWEGRLRSRVILQVHDELIIQACREEVVAVSEILKRDMENVYALDVPLVAEVNTGENWFVLK